MKGQKMNRTQLVDEMVGLMCVQTKHFLGRAYRSRIEIIILAYDSIFRRRREKEKLRDREEEVKELVRERLRDREEEVKKLVRERLDERGLEHIKIGAVVLFEEEAE